MANRKGGSNKTRNTILIILAVAVAALIIVFLATGSDPLGLFTKSETISAAELAQATASPDSAAAPAAYAPPADFNGVTVEMVDIGIGDGLIVMYPNGEVMVVDTGEKLDAHFLIDALNEKHIQKIDYLVLTHPHTDHIGGAQEVLATYEVTNIIMPKASHTTSTYEKLLKTISKGDYTVTQARRGLTMDIGGAHLEFISPVKGEEYDNPNEYSAVFYLTYGDTTMLFTGDMETPNESSVMDAGLDRDIDILKVAHHGSKTSSGKKWLKTITPEAAIVSAYGESENRPNADIMERYAELGIEVHRTDLVGDIYVYIDKAGYNIVDMNNFHERRPMGDD